MCVNERVLFVDSDSNFIVSLIVSLRVVSLNYYFLLNFFFFLGGWGGEGAFSFFLLDAQVGNFGLTCSAYLYLNVPSCLFAFGST